jgi:hypothetical protein
MRRLVLVLAALGALLVAATGVALARAEPQTETFRAPFETEQPDPCTSTTLHVTGVFTFVSNFTKDAQGGIHGAGTFNVQGTAIAEDGTKYRVIQSAPNSFTQTDESGEEGTFQGKGMAAFRFISQDGSSNFISRSNFHFTRLLNDPDEPVVIEFTHIDEKCTGRG